VLAFYDGPSQARDQHLSEVMSISQSQSSKKTMSLYKELLSKYRWNLYVGFMLHVI
jgi:hypothetical protein